jgi:hypothetical protein
VPAAIIASAAGALADAAVVALATASIGCVLVRTAIEWIRIDQVREQADHWLITHTGQPPNDAVLLARIGELLTPRLRTSLASRFRRIATEAATTHGPILAPAQINRRHLRPHIPDLDLLADKLADTREPVSPRGVALANRLLTHGGGPLHSPHRARELATTLPSTLHALDAGTDPTDSLDGS